ncbi:EGF-like domain protein [Necator americanus]|uniref:EGF-like domain protein n=1 Tax=Necator americanus TaxID=51031 RepID=W2TNC5_NECAM|nr:EGF-like domain protein [Necator americanus]ETN82636.1 EGF-like domain protein [Necator americanus]
MVAVAFVDCLRIIANAMETLLDGIANKPTCHADGSFAICKCLKGFSGNTCAVQDTLPTCDSNPCKNGGKCQLIKDLPEDGLLCNCAPGFEGNFCEHPDVVISAVNEDGYQLVLQSLPRQTTFDVFATRFGKTSDSEYFVGCAADFIIGDSDIDLATSSRGTGIAHVRSRAGGKSVHELESHKIVNDNKDHIIQVYRERRQVRLDIDGKLDSEGTIPSRFDHPMFAEKLQLGSSRGVPKDAFITDDNFKGNEQYFGQTHAGKRTADCGRYGHHSDSENHRGWPVAFG